MKLTLVMAVTADGIIARDSMEFVDWTGKADKQYFVRVTKAAGVMIMGSKTFDTIGNVLPGRKSVVITRDQSRVSGNNDLVYTDKSPVEILQWLEDEGYTSATLIGGSIINTLFMEQGLVDEVHLTMVPLFFGRGLLLFNRDLDVKMELIDASTIEKDCLLLKYRILHPD